MIADYSPPPNTGKKWTSLSSFTCASSPRRLNVPSIDTCSAGDNSPSSSHSLLESRKPPLQLLHKLSHRPPGHFDLRLRQRSDREAETGMKTRA